MGPVIQYATESVDPIEVRIYPGADGQFILYEDENDNYNYEKEFYSTIDFNWDEKNKQLIIDDRKGEFPTMLKKREFHVIIINEKKGKGVDVSQAPDYIVKYDGNKKIITFD